MGDAGVPAADAAAGRRASTLKDVARLAGVSVGTASRALNDRAEVSAATKQKVRSAAERLSFYPNALATGLLRGRTKSIGLLTGDVNGRFSIPILMGLEDAFGVGEMSVLMCEGRGDPEREAAHVRTLLAHRVDGLIVVGAIPDARPSIGQHLPVPVVYALSPSTDPRDTSVISDDAHGGRLAAEHVVAAGRRRIAYVTGNPSDRVVHDRIRGSREVLLEHGLDFVAGTPVFGDWAERWGREVARRLLPSMGEIDAVICGNDTLARGVQDVLRAEGIRVPEDVSVVGFDNWEIVAANADPAITSVDMNLVEIGRRSAHALDRAGGATGSGVELVPCRLEVRASSLA
ncbi:transcriptional regulator, LacI family [Beutenbergia cavernae DSM 12333]|uniref:Transcriptional regulator, LacI family n=1 Tax=Beutenbergia cavernae (strain ATCC BAA-8 / DSM 12333 / CCUG 43141 / JCM 11478 / NBRC 16432 / NCIMB 13614 / HKI 0122) TaxID=471853 RepID=C5C2P6_BEUC1|nr:LacI family DNA-binding transcriptional regulator [Beutenbergia cavernae]ACQ79732.1 transcriptional regulator, LacI family [Beutenbergia cavernae DSM 12333]